MVLNISSNIGSSDHLSPVDWGPQVRTGKPGYQIPACTISTSVFIFINPPCVQRGTVMRCMLPYPQIERLTVVTRVTIPLTSEVKITTFPFAGQLLIN